MASIEELKALSILEVAESLGMSLQRTGSYTYAWEEHDSFTINVRENYFNWFARSNGGDVIKMVQVVQEELTGEKLSFKQAKHFLEEGSFDVVDVTSVPEKEPFSYYLEPYETKFIEAREYLKEVRGLSDETIDFFSEKGVLAQATKKTGNFYEPIIVFKSLNSQNEVIGASLQGIRENHDLYERGRLKQIMRASDGLTGMHIDIGQPKRLVFAEAPIDLMSYYELHKDELSDVRLVAMDGLKESTISRHVAELLYELGEIKVQVKPENYSTFLSQTAEVTDFFKDGKHQELITLAVDNDTAGHTFINRLADKGISFSSDLPSMPAGRDKMDWNDALKESKEKALDRSQEPINNIGGQQMLENLRHNQDKEILKEDLTMAEPFTDVQKEHIREFFKTRIPDVQTDYIYLNSGQEETAYYLDGYLFTHQYAELIPLSQNQQVDALMSRLVSDDGREFDEIELGFTINRIDQEFLKDKFGYNPDVSIEDYRQSEKNIDRIQAKDEEVFLQSIDRENFTKVLNLVRNSDAWTVFYLKTDEELGVSTSQVYDFINRYLDPNHDLDYGFDNQFFLDLKTEDLLKKAEEKGLYLSQKKRTNIDQLRENEGEAVLPAVEQEITEYKLEPRWASANEIKADSFEELKMKFLEQMDRHIELEKEFTASSLEFQKDRHSIAMGVWSDKQILKYMRDDSFDFEVNGLRIESGLDDNPYDLLDSISEDGKILDEVTYNKIQKEIQEYQKVQVEEYETNEKMNQTQVRKEELERDTDGDGIPDAIERNMGTNPYSPDTDGDGKSDQEEISYGSNPLASDNSKNDNLSSSGQQKTVAELIAAKDSKGLAQVLKEGVKDYFKSDTYKQYLLAMSKFHNYSPLNIQMILRQNPRASHVASFKKWKDEFSRSVNKGEKALRIFAPITVKKRDSKTNEPLLDKDGKEITYTSFKLVPVFDVSQTDGKELPKPVYELKGSYQDYGNLYKSAKEVSEANGVPISFSENTKGAKGYYSPVSNEIVIKKGLSEQHTLKTIFHEMAHSDLHNLEKRAETPFNLSTAELQAESVAFVVASHYGLDTSEYSFGYLANWTQDPRGLSDLEGQIKIVQKEADSLIARIDQALEKYQSKELTKDAFQQKLDRLKEQSKEQTLESKQKETAKDEIKKAEKSDNQLNL